jgi:hypothetical protein
MEIRSYPVGDFGAIDVGYTGDVIGRFHQYPAERAGLLELAIGGERHDLLQLVPSGWEVYVWGSSSGLIAPDGIKKAKLGNPEELYFVPYALHEISHIIRIEEIALTGAKPAPSYTEFLEKELNPGLQFTDVLSYMQEEYSAWQYSLSKLAEYRVPAGYLRGLHDEIGSAIMSYIDFFTLPGEDNAYLVRLLEKNSGMQEDAMRRSLLDGFQAWKMDFL